jgi:arabinose-5-phosphate isomerase
MNHNYIEIARETLAIESKTLLDASKLLGEEINDAVAKILQCRGKLIVTGVGKSGLIGAKMAATFASTGTPSFFLHPTEALHGDLGMIGKEDVVLAISYSGESEELSAILPHIKRFEIPLIGMTRNAESTLGSFSDIVLPIKVEKEACPLDVAPTSSTTLTLAVGDALAVCLMKARAFKKEDFASFHPGGSLGKRLFVKVEDLMRKTDLPIVTEQTPVKEAIVAISEGRLGNVLIADADNKLVAVMSDGDVRRALMESGFSLEAPVSEYATYHPKTIDDAAMLASDALVMIENMKIQFLAVTDKERNIKGVLHIHALVEAGIS